ncbi:MAG: biopolymer transporter ExbD [Deferribacteres bacterium]|nr:biopolymer transporter ExbD [candidate division KSB1 bacterium]MCB9502705.1 biopolymer transporter ExbD [Deferribacteres bacterium]
MEINSKIEITPLVGVALILVIVFMVTSPLIMAPMDMEVDLPKAATREAKSETNITISLSKTGVIALNEDKLPRQNLQGALQVRLKEHPERLVVIRADKNVRHAEILDLLTIAKNAGAQNVALATVQRNRSGS